MIQKDPKDKILEFLKNDIHTWDTKRYLRESYSLYRKFLRAGEEHKARRVISYLITSLDESSPIYDSLYRLYDWVWRCTSEDKKHEALRILEELEKMLNQNEPANSTNTENKG